MLKIQTLSTLWSLPWFTGLAQFQHANNEIKKAFNVSFCFSMMKYNSCAFFIKRNLAFSKYALPNAEDKNKSLKLMCLFQNILLILHGSHKVDLWKMICLSPPELTCTQCQVLQLAPTHTYDLSRVVNAVKASTEKREKKHWDIKPKGHFKQNFFFFLISSVCWTTNVFWEG